VHDLRELAELTVGEEDNDVPAGALNGILSGVITSHP
jgi:hypothetical protein